MDFINLPHFHPTTAVTHITYRLAGSVPRARLDDIKEEREHALSQLERNLTGVSSFTADEVRQRQRQLIDARMEYSVDAYLDSASNGPYYLADPKVARLVLDSLRFLKEENSMELYAACIMSNHVHLLVGCPKSLEQLPLNKLMQRHKRHTARAANKLLDRTGQPFWESNYFDRYVRPGKFFRVLLYVLNNPVAAGLVTDWWEWPHTYLRVDLKSSLDNTGQEN